MSSHDNWIFRRGTLWSANLTGRTESPTIARIPTEFGTVQPDSLAQLAAAVGQMDPIDPGALARRFELGKQCFVMRVDGSIAAYGWLTRGPEWVGEFERELRVLEGEAYIWDCATLPNYRRQRLFSVLLAHVTNQLRHEGLRRLWLIGINGSQRMIDGVQAAGFQPILGLAYARLFDKHGLLARSAGGASPQQLAAGQRLLRAEHETAHGSLIVGNSARPQPPDTHFDR